MLNTKQRKNIVREANALIKLQVKEFDSFPIGKRESVQDNYIQLVCEQKGIDFIHFYNEEGKKLEKILGVI